MKYISIEELKNKSKKEKIKIIKNIQYGRCVEISPEIIIIPDSIIKRLKLRDD